MTIYCASIKEHRGYGVYRIDTIENVSKSESIFFADTTAGNYVSRISGDKLNQAGQFFPARDYHVDFFMTDKDGNIIDFVEQSWVPIIDGQRPGKDPGCSLSAIELFGKEFEPVLIEKQMDCLIEMLLGEREQSWK